MSLRARIAAIIGITVLVASSIGGLGTAISSRNVGRDRVDDELRADAALFPSDNPQITVQLQRAFELRQSSCRSNQDDAAAGANTDTDRAGRNGRRIRFLPDFASGLQIIRKNGVTVSACNPLPISEQDRAIAASGEGTTFRTVTVDENRLRVLTQGYGDIGAMQFARDLDLTDDAVRGLMARIVGFGLIGALLAGGLGWMFARKAIAPIDELNATARRVAHTRDLGERIDVTRDDEIGALAGSFNTMLSSLDTSREQQQRLVQDASHELRTPLTSMRTNVELLQRHQQIDAETRAQVLADINSELAELTDLTAELVESATEVPTSLSLTTPIDLSQLATECVERAMRRHRRTIGLAIDTDHDPSATDTVIVLGDAALLTRAISNLINNAVKFSDQETAIDVVVRHGDITVNDRGPGVSPPDLPRIFDRFYRADGARSEPGSGLGLAIVKQIVEGHGGEVHASAREGGGLTIGFSLPPAGGGATTFD